MCDCVKRANEQLAAHNARIGQAILMPREGSSHVRARTIVHVEKIDPKKRKPLPPLFANYCPFCGESADAADAALDNAETTGQGK